MAQPSLPRSFVLLSLCLILAVKFGPLSADGLDDIPDDDPPAAIRSEAVIAPIGARLSAGDSSVAPTATTAPVAGCPRAHPWRLSPLTPTEEVEARIAEYVARGFRLHSLSATGTEAGRLFSLLFHADEPDAWGHRLNQTPDELFDDPFWTGLRPVSVAMTLEDGDRLVSSSWVADGHRGRVRFGETLDEIQAIVDMSAGEGFSPVWFDAARQGDMTRFVAVLSDDGIRRELQIDDRPAYEAWRAARTDTQWRMIHAVDLDLPDATEPRIASIWQNDPDHCGRVQWKAHVRISLAELLARGWAQHLDPPVHSYGADGTVTLETDSLPGLMRLETDLPRPLRRIAVTGAVEDGAIVVFDTMTRDSITVVDEPGGNIRLRRWDGTVGEAGFSRADIEHQLAQILTPTGAPLPSAICQTTPPASGCRGQPMPLADWQARLALQYRAALDEWHEIARNGMPPDRYMPVSVTATGSGAGRRYSGAYILRGTDRVFTVVPHAREAMHHPLSTVVQPFFDEMDAEFRAHMEARLIPKADVAVAVDGQVVFSRLYRYEPEAYQARTPAAPGRARFRLASLTKPITALGVMRLVQEGSLDLDAPLAALPGLADLLGPAWADSPILQNSARTLLLHIGGWDRDRVAAHSTGNAFTVCAGDEGTMPVAQARHVAHWAGQALSHPPGTTYVYSNVGYFLLGRAIEAASGASFEDYMHFAVLHPIGADTTALVAPMGVGAPPPEPSGAVRHHFAGNPMVAAGYGFDLAQNPAHRRACNETDADIVLSPYGRRDLRAGEDPGGAMVSTAVDLLRIMLAMGDEQYLSRPHLREMMTRAPGQGLAVATWGAPGSFVIPHNRSFDARVGSGDSNSTPIELAPEAGAMLFLGQGYGRFERVNIHFATLGAGYGLRFEYTAARPDGWAWEELTEAHGLDDSSAGFATANAQSRAVIAFDPPDDWLPTVQVAMPDAPRFWLRVTSLATPTTVARAHHVSVSDAGGNPFSMARVLGWGTEADSENLHELFLPSGDSAALQAAVGDRVVGASSQTSATLVEALPLFADTALLRLRNIEGAGFEPAETLARGHPFGPDLGRVGIARELALTKRLAHGGLLPGVRTSMSRRADGISWAILFNQSQPDEAFYLPNHAQRPGINRVIDDHDNNPTRRWPPWSLID